VITPDDKLQFAYAVGQAGFGDFGPARPISLSAVEAQGGVTVRVRDELGNVGERSWRAAQVALRPDLPDPVSAAPMPGYGCSSTGGFGLLGLTALTLLVRRRR
jgi:MYXO-CTERM domain-containing protein